MPEDRTPLDGQVWTDPNGRPMLYVRTEETLGRDGSRHLFVSTHDRIVWTRWLPDGAMPEGYELAADRHGAERARKDRETMVAERIQHQLEMIEMGAEREALVVAMQRAVAAVPPIVATDIRRVYRAARGRLLGVE